MSVLDARRYNDPERGLPRPQWGPYGRLDASPLDVTSPALAKEAKQLEGEVTRTRTYLAKLKATRQEEYDALAAANVAYERELKRSAAAGEDSEEEHRLHEAVEELDANFRKSTDAHNIKLREAETSAKAAAAQFADFKRRHALELVFETENRALQNAAKYRKAQADYDKATAALALERGQLVSRNRALLAELRPFTADDIPDTPGEPPFPTTDALERYARLNEPDPEPSEEE